MTISEILIFISMIIINMLYCYFHDMLSSAGGLSVRILKRNTTFETKDTQQSITIDEE